MDDRRLRQARDTRPVLVTGATGRIGRAIVQELVAANVAVRALTREPSTAAFPPGVEVVAGDLTEPDSIGLALRGVGAVFLVWTAAVDTAAAVVELIEANTRRLVLLSAPHQTPHPFFQQPNPMARLYVEIERLIVDAGLAWTFIRPGIFASNAELWWGPALRAGDIVRWPYGAAETAPIDERDVAAVSARVLLDEGHEGGDYVLTGSGALSQAEQVRVIGAVLHRRIRFEELSAEEFRRETASTWPASVTEMLLDAWAATMGHPAFVTSTVADILGSPARTFRSWVADHASAFRPTRQ